MIAGLPLTWIVAVAFAVSVGGYVWHCEKSKDNFKKLVYQLEAQAKEQEKRNKERADQQAKAKEEADAKAKRDTAQLHRTIARLRDERSRASLVPAAPAASDDPARACFDRAELDGALRKFEEGITGLLAEGEQAVIGLDAAKAWQRLLPR